MKYLFYKFYSWSYFLYKDRQNPVWTAFLTISFLIFINLITIFFILTKVIYIPKINISKMSFIFIGMIINIPLYFLLIHNKNYEKIINKYIYESKKQKTLGTIYSWGYIIGTFLGFFLIAYFLG